METCSMDWACKNGVRHKGEALAQCALCRFAYDNLGRSMSHHWIPLEKLLKHPALEAEKYQKKIDKHRQVLDRKRQRDPKKRQVSRLAAKAEKITERNIIHATKNSGRRNKDGDHVSMGMITLDTKLQTTRENPVILLGELEKVRNDAMRAGKQIGGLVIRNKYNVGVVVFSEQDYATLTQGLNSEQQMEPTISGPGEGSSNLV